MKSLLSICIPSYNRSVYLPDLLSSIVHQYDSRVEIVICDNGSTDETEVVVRRWQEQYPRIIYEKFIKNVGPDRCFLRSVEMASSPFCWLMGDDDIIEEGALEKIISLLNDEVVGITVNRIAYNSSLQKKWMEPPIGPIGNQKFTNANTCLKALFPLFGFLSAQIICRSAWLNVVEEEDVSPYYNAYSLIYIIGRMIQKDPRWLYLHTPCVGWRSDNDSFAKQLGMLGRFALDIKGYKTIIYGLCKSDPKLRSFLINKICSIHFFAHVKKIKLFSSGALSLCLEHLKEIPSFWYKLLPLLMMPRKILVWIRFFYLKWHRVRSL